MDSKLRSGTTLIVDRYSFSGVAFSSAKGLDMEWCKAPEIGLLAPDLVVYLEISPEPYRTMKDHRTEYEVSDPDSVLQGDVDGFILNFLSASLDKDEDDS